jgi:hypothetical protein
MGLTFLAISDIRYRVRIVRVVVTVPVYSSDIGLVQYWLYLYNISQSDIRYQSLFGYWNSPISE